MADKTSYDDCVVVDESEWKFNYGDYETNLQKVTSCPYCGANSTECGSCGYPRQLNQNTLNPRVTSHSLKMMGFVEWNITFNDQAKTVDFSCQSVSEKDAAVEDDKVHAELIHYSRSVDDEENNESYEKQSHLRRLFCRSSAANSSSLTYNLQLRDHVFTIRILKDRAMFPDFTLESTVVSRMPANCKLRVAGQLFHVNKELLAMHCDHFDRLFNDEDSRYVDEEIELRHEPANAAVFHDFLLVMFVAEALPNPKNVTALTHLANTYRADIVRDKCHRHLWTCRELHAAERHMLAGELGFHGLQTSLIANASLKENQSIALCATKRAFPHY